MAGERIGRHIDRAPITREAQAVDRLGSHVHIVSVFELWAYEHTCRVTRPNRACPGPRASDLPAIDRAPRLTPILADTLR